MSHMQAVMVGLNSIRAYGQQARYLEGAERVVDQQTLTFFWFYALNRWVGIRLDWITTVLAFITVTLCVASRDSLQPGLVGLTVVYALRTGGVFQFALRLAAETEANLTAVERLRHYSHSVPQESVTTQPKYSDSEAIAAVRAAFPTAYLSDVERTVAASPAVVGSGAERDAGGCAFEGWYPRTWSNTLIQSAWPRVGEIELKDVSVKYRADTPLVLRGVSLRIKGGLRIGVCGRTGR